MCLWQFPSLVDEVSQGVKKKEAVMNLLNSNKSNAFSNTLCIDAYKS